MTWSDSLGNIKTLDQWRESIGLTYNFEKAPRPVSGRAPVRRADARMPYGTVAGLEKKVSRLVLGVDHPRNLPYAAALFDDFIERGGNCFDTAWQYAGGICEKLLGQWMAMRGLRKDVVILDKGAHTPFCDPVSLNRQFAESLERLQTDHVDIYMIIWLTRNWSVAGIVTTISNVWRAPMNWRGNVGFRRSSLPWLMC